MKNRLLALSCLCLLVLNTAGSAIGDVGAKRKASPANQLAAMLPATDGIVTIDVKRFLSDAMPKLLASNPAMLGRLTEHMDEMKATTGVDFRQFDHAAIGIRARKIAEKKYDIDPVVITRGQVSTAALIEAAKTAANGKHREEKIGNRTIYLFPSKAAVDKAKQQVPTASPQAVDTIARKLPKDIAVVALDGNTLLFGEDTLVRQAVSERPAANPLLKFLGKKETSIVDFAGKLPGGMSAFIPLDNDELGKNIDSIQFVYGNMDMITDGMVMNVTARTLQPAQATALLETLEGLQIIGKAFLGGSKGADKQVYARLIDNAKFSAKGNEVIFDLQVAQGDIDVLAGLLK